MLYTAAEMRERRLSDGKSSRLAVFSWILYDFSNTIFSVTILSFYFPLWVEEQVGSGGLFSGAGLVNSATAPSTGAVSTTKSAETAVAELTSPAPENRPPLPTCSSTQSGK